MLQHPLSQPISCMVFFSFSSMIYVHVQTLWVMIEPECLCIRNLARLVPLICSFLRCLAVTFGGFPLLNVYRTKGYSPTISEEEQSLKSIPRCECPFSTRWLEPFGLKVYFFKDRKYYYYDEFFGCAAKNI